MGNFTELDKEIIRIIVKLSNSNALVVLGNIIDESRAFGGSSISFDDQQNSIELKQSISKGVSHEQLKCIDGDLVYKHICLLRLLDRLEDEGYISVLIGTTNFLTETPDDFMYHLTITDENMVKRYMRYAFARFFPTSNMGDLLENDFKTIEDMIYEKNTAHKDEEIGLVKKQLKIQMRMFWVTFIALIITSVFNAYSAYANGQSMNFNDDQQVKLSENSLSIDSLKSQIQIMQSTIDSLSIIWSDETASILMTIESIKGQAKWDRKRVEALIETNVSNQKE